VELRKPAPKRHASLLVPRANGRLARRQWFDEAERDVFLNIFDGQGADGTPATLDENLAAIEAAWYADPGGDSTLALELHLDPSTVYAGDVQVTDFGWSIKSPIRIRAVLTICILAGALELVP
jgi:hypothetical protein